MDLSNGKTTAEPEPVRKARHDLPWPVALLCLLGLVTIGLALLITNIGTVTEAPVAESKAGNVSASNISQITPTLPLPNPGFEDALHNWTPGLNMVGVDSQNQGYLVLADRSIQHSGTASALLQSMMVNLSSTGALSSEMEAKHVRGKRIRYSAYLRTEDVVGWSGLDMYIYRTLPGSTNLDKLPMSWDQMFDRSIEGTTDWQRYEIVLDVPPEATLITFGVELWGTGRVWMDDIEMEIVGDDVPSTDQGDVKKQQNLDFEDGFTGWISYTMRSTAQTDAYTMGTGIEMAYTGNLGAYIRSTEPPGSNEYGVLGPQAVYAGYYQGKTVRFSAFINADKVQDHAILWIVSPTRDSQGGIIAVPNETTIPGRATQNGNSAVDGRSGWRKYEVSFDVPADAPNIIFDLRLFGEGEVWIDDVEFTIVDKASAP
jgi:hypothetical protein